MSSNRNEIGPAHAVECMVHGLKNDKPQLWVGPPGVGKTDMIKQAARRLGWNMIIMHPVVSDPTDFKGLPFKVVDPKTGDPHGEFLPFSDLQKMLVADEPLVAFIDDLIQAPPAVQAAAMQLVLAREINGKKVSKHVRFMAATNRKEDKAGGSVILEPIKSRFCILHAKPDQSAWARWALQNNVDPIGVAWTNFKPDFINNIVHDPDLVNTPSPRTITELIKDWSNGGYPTEVEHTYLSGWAGPGAATELLTFARVHNNLPDVDKYMDNPNKFKTPTKPDILYALAGALAARATKKNAEKFFQAVNTLGPDFSVVAVRDALHRDPTLHNVGCITDWVLENQEVLI